MKNKNFDRNLNRQINKAKRDIEICMLYNSLHNISEVARRMKLNEKTVKKALDSLYTAHSDGAVVIYRFQEEPMEIEK